MERDAGGMTNADGRARNGRYLALLAMSITVPVCSLATRFYTWLGQSRVGGGDKANTYAVLVTLCWVQI
jgi:hypothetical protein